MQRLPLRACLLCRTVGTTWHAQQAIPQSNVVSSYEFLGWPFSISSVSRGVWKIETRAFHFAKGV
jgi:hypothetical protein